MSTFLLYLQGYLRSLPNQLMDQQYTLFESMWRLSENGCFVTFCTLSVSVMEEEGVYHDEVEIEDFEYDEDTETYYYPCPCGDKFEISKVCQCMSIFTRSVSVCILRVPGGGFSLILRVGLILSWPFISGGACTNTNLYSALQML